MAMFIRCKNFLRLCHLLWLLFIFSCGKESKPTQTVKLGGVYRLPIRSDITSLDPNSRESSWSIINQIYEGLVTYSKDETTIIPCLAERFSITDSSLIFYLRRGVKFHDDPCFPDGKGREFTAADVKYSLGRPYRRSEFPEAFLGYEEFVRGRSSQIEGFKAIDQYTFAIRLAKPDPDLLSNLASGIIIMPPEAVEFYGEDFKWHPVGTGPFRFSEIVPNEKIILVKNQNYWGYEDGMRLPYLDAVEYFLYPSEAKEKMLLDFQTGKIDECNEEVADNLRDLVESDHRGHLIFKGWLRDRGVQLVKDQGFRKLRYLHVIEKNQKVRQAMAYAIDRRRLIDRQESIFQNYEIAKGPVPSSVGYYDKNLAGQYYNPDRARKLLEEAGFPHGHGLPKYPFISLPSPDVDCIVADLEAVGFKIKKVDPFPAWREWLDKGEPLLVRLMNIMTTADVYDLLRSIPIEYCLADTSFIRAFQEWQKNEASYRNKMLLHRLEKMITDITPIVFLYPSAATPQPKGRMIIWQNNFLIILPNHYSAF